MSISVKGITKEFKNKRNKGNRNIVLKDISFEVRNGEFVSLLGPSGCGKTTTLTIIAGFQTHDEGQILINGNQVEKPGPGLGHLFYQNYALFPWMKVEESVIVPHEAE